MIKMFKSKERVVQLLSAFDPNVSTEDGTDCCCAKGHLGACRLKVGDALKLDKCKSK